MKVFRRMVMEGLNASSPILLKNWCEKVTTLLFLPAAIQRLLRI
jgi:hypothetical protein